MSLCCPHQSRTSRARRGYELLHENKKKPLRKICRLSDWVEQNTEPRNNSVQQDINPPDSSDQTESSGRISSQQKPAPAATCCCQNKAPFHKPTQETISKEEFDTFPRFGPSYGEDNEAIKMYKKEAWIQVWMKTTGEEPTVYDNYLSEIKKIEDDAKETYDAPIVERLKRSKFQRMMIIDGCYFLQLALYILGGDELLGYPQNHPDFGITDRKRKISQWIKAMFFIGNQIPYVVIRALMKQKFFQDVIVEGIEIQTWDPPSDLPKMALYLLVVEPELKKYGRSSSWLFSKLKRQEKPPSLGETCPSDLLHGLHCLVLGPGSDPLDWEAFDLEAGTKELDKRFPSATEVEQVGVTLEKAKPGIREIKFRKKYFFFPRLYVPPFTFGADTDLMLQYLKGYEIEQKIRKSKCEVTAYLRFMSDLIQTMKDVDILKSREIIQVTEDVKEDNKLPAMLNNLPAMLNTLGSSEKTLTQNLRLTRLQIVNYSTTTRNLISAAALLTLVQTVFTILSYVQPRN